MKFGYAAMLGRPNTGKSTLLNAMLQQKVSITSPLPQTTRKVVEGVYDDSRGQIVFWDTPGISGQTEDVLGRNEGRSADVVLCLFDISRPKSDEDNKVIGMVRKMDGKKILVYNKIDKAVGSKDHLAEYQFLEEEFDRVVTLSALRDRGVKQLITEILELLPEATEDQIVKPGMVLKTDSKEFISEIIREKAYLYLRRELPYTVNVEVDEVIDKRKLILVKARVITSADRYKKMIIGRDGYKIKQIGSHARKELELMSGRKVFLELLVTVDKHSIGGY